MKEFINYLNLFVYIFKLNESGIIMIFSVEELFLKYGVDIIELKNEIVKLLNIISDFYIDVKKLVIFEEVI